jgi:hypothetical protein
MLFGGAAMTLIGRSVLLVEGARAARDRTGAATPGPAPHLIRFQRASLAGAFLIGLSTFQGEFDFGVPQFDFVFQPVLIALAASTALVAARLWAGRGGALVAVALFLAVRGLVSLLVGPVFGETTPHFPLYVVEAALVELVALRGVVARPLAFGLASGALIGTVGLAAEWGWSHLWMPLPWPGSMLAEALALGLAAALAGGAIGALIGAALASDRIARPRGAGIALAGAAVAVVAVAGIGLQTSPGPSQSARVALTDVQPGPQRTVSARVELSPAGGAADAKWLTVTAWQGGGLVLDRLERVRAGVYRTTKPIPVHGEWKALLRLHSGDSLRAAPIYLPHDPAIPAAEVPAPARFTRAFVPDKQVLQREAKDGAPGLAAVGYLSVLSFALGLLALMAWGLRRLARAGSTGWGTRPRAGRAARPRRSPVWSSSVR